MTANPAPMTTRELLELAELPTCDLPVAGRAFGLGINRPYELAGAGDFPCRVLRLGRRFRVPTADLLDALGIVSTSNRSAVDV